MNNTRPVLVVCAFLFGVLLTAGTYAESPAMVILGAFFGFIFFGIAIVGGVHISREIRKQRRYERSKKGLSWRS